MIRKKIINVLQFRQIIIKKWDEEYSRAKIERIEPEEVKDGSAYQLKAGEGNNQIMKISGN